MSSVQDLVTAIISGKATEIESSFKSAISDKVLDMVSDMKTEMAQGIFKEGYQLDELSNATLDSYRKKAFDEPGFTKGEGRRRATDKLSSYGDSKVLSSENIASAKSEIKNLISPEHHAKYPISKITNYKSANKIYKDAKAAGHLNEELDLEDYQLEEIEDFMMSEEFEQLDEISKKTLGSYIKYASDDRAAKSLSGGLSASDTKGSVESDKLLKQADKRKAGIRTALTKLTKEDLDEAVNHSAFIKKYKENEDDNEHSKNVVHLAKHVGSSEDQEEANDILKSHNKAGHLTSEVSKRRDTLHKKLWSPAIQKAYNK
jgi:hypothetical protein